MEDREMIEMKFHIKGYVRLPCDICGGWTGKELIGCEGVDERSIDIRICETCLEQREQIDAKLEEHAAFRVEQAAWLRSLIGRIKAPSPAEWKARLEAYKAKQAAEEFEVAEMLAQLEEDEGLPTELPTEPPEARSPNDFESDFDTLINEPIGNW